MNNHRRERRGGEWKRRKERQKKRKWEERQRERETESKRDGRGEEERSGEEKRRGRRGVFFGNKPEKDFIFFIHIPNVPAVAIILFFPSDSAIYWGDREISLSDHLLNTDLSLFKYTKRVPWCLPSDSPSPHHPAHSHLPVFLPFAAVKIKLHIMVAITSLASWLLLTPNQLFCFLVMFIAIAGQIVCFENAKSNSPMCKKEHLIGFQCSLCWFELRANEDRWVGVCVYVCACVQM